MRSRTCLLPVMLLGASVCFAQVHAGGLASSHASTVKKTSPATASIAAASAANLKPVVRVNGAVITELDVRREMYAIFPYAQQHGGSFPKELEPEIRKGAVDMVIFEELLYQEAKLQNRTVSPERLNKAEAAFLRQFPDKATFDQYLKIEMNGSKAAMREKIRRSLLIEQMLKTEVDSKTVVTSAMAKAYYDANGKQFEHGETFSIQTISILPPENASKATLAEAAAKIKDIVRLAKATKTYREFGLIAEQVSEDDWRTQLGDRKAMKAGELPPEILKACRALKIEGVSDAIAVGRAWVVLRLNAHSPAGKTPFVEAKKKIQSDLQTQKRVEIRSALNQQLHKGAKIEML
jgi:peptidyl-prolyl cis-trans isomerase SurA